MRFIPQVHIDGAEPFGTARQLIISWTGAGPKGLAIRQLKWYVSWVCPIFRGVVRQFGPYLSWAQAACL